MQQAMKERVTIIIKDATKPIVIDNFEPFKDHVQINENTGILKVNCGDLETWFNKDTWLSVSFEPMIIKNTGAIMK